MVTKTQNKKNVGAQKSKISRETSKSKTSTKKAKIIYEQPKKKKDYLFPIILLITAIIIVGFVSNGTFFLGKTTESSDETVVKGDLTVLASVNGEHIYQSELDEYWNRLPPQIKLQLTKEGLLDEFVQERLLLQEADKNNIEVSESEVDEYIAAQLSASGLTLEQFEGILAQQGTTVDRMKEIYTRQLKLAKLFEERSDEDLQSSDEEIQAYYDENKESFYQPEQVTVRHILVPINENIDEETARERASEIETSLKEAKNENFCELVSEYSGDPGSVNNCGEYTFARGAMVEEFETAGFDMEVGELRTVKTAFGFHIMIKDADIDAGFLGLEDSIGAETVKSTIERVLAEEKARAVYEAYITELRDDAEIIYPEAEEGNAKEEVVEDAPEIEETVEVVEDENEVLPSAEIEDSEKETENITIEIN